MAEEPTKPANVIEAIAMVILDLPAIDKGETFSGGGSGTYKYRGIEQITAAVQPLLGKHGVVFVPRIQRSEPLDLTINGKPWVEWRCEVVYTVYGPGGIDDHIEVGPIIGLGRDNADKGINKALSQAFKYALVQTLCIGDRGSDADGERHETEAWGGRQQAHRPPPDLDALARADGWDSVADYQTHSFRLREATMHLDDNEQQVLKEWIAEKGLKLDPGPKLDWTVAWEHVTDMLAPKDEEPF
jgi:hypothetical protein